VIFWLEVKLWLCAYFFDYNKVAFSPGRNSFENNIFNFPNDFVEFFSGLTGGFVRSLYFAG